MLNDDEINRRYINEIQHLNNKGADIRLIRSIGIMHHKFCIIDKAICMFGSFNWTETANIRNIEDLNICDDYNVVANYLLEFNYIWDLSKDDIKLLKNPAICKNCGEPIVNILLMQPDGNYQTKIEILQQCGCAQRIVYTDYYDASAYNNYLGIIQQFDDNIIAVQQSGDKISYHQLVAQRDFVVGNYLSHVRYNRMGMPIIHAVGTQGWKWIDKHTGYPIWEIIWKERGTSTYVKDEYQM